MEQRLLGRYEGKAAGPLLLCIGAMHGNEPAGVEAIRQLFELLEYEPVQNPGFIYRGNVVGLIGNLSALREKKRFMERDLNRMLSMDEVDRILSVLPEKRAPEELECIELINSVQAEIDRYKPEETLILDFHTTTADGGIFTICAEDSVSRDLAMGLFAPVILGLAEILPGTTIGYFNRPTLRQYCIVFEAGQHNDPECVHRSVAAVVNCMRSIGSVNPHDVDHRHDGLLIRLSIGLPKMTQLIHHYKIQPGENFIMNPGYENFQKIEAGEFLANNNSGNVISPVTGLILMPKYQSQGDDGFFIVENLDL
ncbi:MAG: succinylglutamate desuccinylase/aspartoacylase family protein [Bacteroidota bacterium]|nr:succinylglutamate desuccinylase/aspartoacylase family protein [Bacteroidota bacterium]